MPPRVDINFADRFRIELQLRPMQVAAVMLGYHLSQLAQPR
ncbi:hypothetical protein [Candidatus Aquiluna sp. UB-MaderosW2red]|nr:hypothetical protein [Candidatus Aquiluna sp. UB-MaderosW2red]